MRRRDRGQITVAMLGVSGAVLAAALAALGLTRVVTVAHTARGVADLCALAAASAASRGEPATGACAQAARIAAANHVTLTRCSVSADFSATVSVTAPVPGSIWPPARSTARAGPG